MIRQHICLFSFFNNLFARYKEYMTFPFSWSKFSDVLPAFTRAGAIGNLWSICLRVNVFSRVRLKILDTRARSKGPPSPFIVFIGYISLLKALKALRFNFDVHKEHLYYQKYFPFFPYLLFFLFNYIIKFYHIF